MRVGIRLSMAGAGFLLGALVLGAPREAYAQQGAIGGQVVDQADGTPLEAARVILTGTSQIEATNREGRFLFRQVNPGTYQVRVLRVGYKPATRSASVAVGETAALLFSLVPAAVKLDELVTTVNVGLDGTTPQFTLNKYADASAPVVVADGIEARLIEAEAQLQADDLPGMTATLNGIRQAFPDLGLADLAEPATQAEGVDLLFAERAFWMFATGHRLGDMRRLVRPLPLGYGRPVDSVFPTGIYIKGGAYGGDVNLPIPIEERNNPNSAGCLDRNP